MALESSSSTTGKMNQWLQEINSCWQQLPSLQVDNNKLKHIALICDGNRRAAEERGLPVFLGHRAGLEVIKGIAKAGRQWGINTLTFWVWSTENWERDNRQVNFVMRLTRNYLGQDELRRELVENEVRFRHIGRLDRFSNSSLWFNRKGSQRKRSFVPTRSCSTAFAKFVALKPLTILTGIWARFSLMVIIFPCIPPVTSF